jgi:hypothetical protein
MAYIRQIKGLNNPAVLETRNLENGRILFALQKSYNEFDLWGLSLDARGFAAGKPFRVTNTTGMEVEGLTASADGKRLAIAFGRGSYAMFVANLSNSGDKLERPRPIWRVREGQHANPSFFRFRCLRKPTRLNALSSTVANGISTWRRTSFCQVKEPQ